MMTPLIKFTQEYGLKLPSEDSGICKSVAFFAKRHFSSITIDENPSEGDHISSFLISSTFVTLTESFPFFNRSTWAETSNCTDGYSSLGT